MEFAASKVDRHAQPTAFRCLLPLELESLEPTQGRHDDKAWIVNPLTRFTSTGTCLDETMPFAEAVASHEPMAWVSDPVTSAVHPFAMSPRLASIAASLVPGAPVAVEIDGQALSVLRAAGIVYNAKEVASERDQWRESLDRYRSEFRQGYARLGPLLHELALEASRQYFHQLLLTDWARLGDGQSARRWVCHNDPVARYFHHQLTPTIETIAAEPLKPSYVYFASYEGGASLPWHTDRAQCEISLSMLIDYYPKPGGESPWPLLLETRQDVVAIHQRLGDTLIYRGRELRHSREELAVDHRSTHLFFHFVPRNFNQSLD